MSSIILDLQKYYDVDSFSVYKGKNGNITLSLTGMIDTKNSNNIGGGQKPYKTITINGIQLELISYRELSPTRWSITYGNSKNEDLFTYTLTKTIIFATFHTVEYNLLLGGGGDSLLWKNYMKQLARQLGTDFIFKFRVSNNVYFENDCWDVYTIVNEIVKELPFNIVLSNVSNYNIKDFKVSYGMNLLSVLNALIVEPFLSVRRLPNTRTYVVEPAPIKNIKDVENKLQGCLRLVGESKGTDFNEYGIVIVGGFGKPKPENLPQKPLLPEPLEDIKESVPISSNIIDQFS